MYSFGAMKTHSAKKLRSPSGFTLVELLVVIAIVAVLVAIGVGSILKFRGAANKTVTMGNVRQLQLANISYASDHNGNYVAVYSFDGDGVLNSHWKVNPEYLALLHGHDVVYQANGKVNVNPPQEFLDQVVVKSKGLYWSSISASYGLNELQGGTWGQKGKSNGLKMSQVNNPARTFAFATATDWIAKYNGSTLWPSNPVKGYDSAGMIAYRYDNKAVIVYFDGHVALMSPADIRKELDRGGRNSVFWNARSGS